MPPPRPAPPASDLALHQALVRVLLPLARLAVARGLPFGSVAELTKQAFVKAASALDSGRDAQPPLVSAVATATGLTRREVTRLLQADLDTPPEKPSLATQVFTLWQGDRKLRNRHGQARALPRLGPAPSFEALAQSVTRDVHPRTLLDELVRLKLAHLDEASDQVHLLEQAFVPRGDDARMLSFLGANVGDHLAATVANVLGEPRKHFDQAVFAGQLSDESIAAAKKLLNAQWRSLMAAVVPELEALVEADRSALQRNRTHQATRRLRIGLYSFDEDAQAPREKE